MDEILEECVQGIQHCSVICAQFQHQILMHLTIQAATVPTLMREWTT